jgi:hypothetical protein
MRLVVSWDIAKHGLQETVSSKMYHHSHVDSSVSKEHIGSCMLLCDKVVYSPLLMIASEIRNGDCDGGAFSHFLLKCNMPHMSVEYEQGGIERYL